MKIESNHIGKTIYGYRHGVNVRHEVKLEKYTVVDVKRRYAEVKPEGWKQTYFYDRETGADKNSIQSGYSGSLIAWFESEADFKEWQESQKRAEKVKAHFRGYNWQRNFTQADMDDLYIFLDSRGYLGSKK